jgi:hypothetical protein
LKHGALFVSSQITGIQLRQLIQSVFSPTIEDRRCAIIVDIPDSKDQDHKAWQDRRRMAYEWAQILKEDLGDLPVKQIDLCIYPNVHSNNADLPEHAFITDRSPEEMTASDLPELENPQSFTQILSEHSIILAPTEFSTTAPLKLLANTHQFRAATMPGFSKKMIPALKLDYNEINRRVMKIKNILDPAKAIDIQMTVNKKAVHHIHFDCRFRHSHASGGRFPKPGTAGNLPSGECYIVPYEGELDEESQSQGTLPVQFEDEVVIYQIEQNKAVEVLSQGPHSRRERDKIKREPAYSNIAELGFGVLKDFGLKPLGQILLDEKLGLHIAFGRSDHFGGAVGVKDFTSPEKVVHIDRIYIPETQPYVQLDSVIVSDSNGNQQLLMEKGNYTIF